jgi:hypothetical protein
MILNVTNDGLCIQEKVYSMVESDDDVTAYDNHPYEDKMRMVKC